MKHLNRSDTAGDTIRDASDRIPVDTELPHLEKQLLSCLIRYDANSEGDSQFPVTGMSVGMPRLIIGDYAESTNQLLIATLLGPNREHLGDLLSSLDSLRQRGNGYGGEPIGESEHRALFFGILSCIARTMIDEDNIAQKK